MSVSQPAFRPDPKVLAVTIVAALGVYLCSVWFRHAAIENAAFGAACLVALKDGTAGVGCQLWQTLIALFNNAVFGSIGLVMAIIALWRPRHSTVALALISAAAGLALYNVAMASFAIAIVLLTLARPGQRQPSAKS